MANLFSKAPANFSSLAKKVKGLMNAQRSRLKFVRNDWVQKSRRRASARVDDEVYN